MPLDNAELSTAPNKGIKAMDIRAHEIQLVKLKTLKLNPKNRNKHSKEQIERLAGIIEYQGFRDPLIVSNLSAHVVAGHGRYEAAKLLKMDHVPVIYQDFENEEQEIAFGVSHNAIASWAELDLSGINTDLADLGPDFNIDMLGIKGFTLDAADKDDNDSQDEKKPDKQMKAIECPHCGQEFEMSQGKKRNI